MSWLRLDDKFVRHPKITRLARGDRWTWLEVLSYCAEYQTEGYVPETISEVVPKATAPFLNRCFELHLLDLEEHEQARYRVHDWRIYNGQTLEEKILAYLEDHPDASANEIQKAVGGKRQLVLNLVPQLKADWFPTGSSGGSSEGTTGNRLGGSLGGLARANPSRPETPSTHRKVSGRDLRSEETEAATPATPNGAAPLIDRMSHYVRQFWDQYPDHDVLADELTDRGLTAAQAANVIQAELERRQETTA